MAKSSRKGKKAWRKNIDTADVRIQTMTLMINTLDGAAIRPNVTLHDSAQVERAVEEHSRAERLGTDVGDLPDSQLFFIDKVRPHCIFSVLI